MSVITYKRGDKTALTKNFSRYEFDCPCGCGTQMVDPELAEKLQRIRDVVGKKIKITSGYRCLTARRLRTTSCAFRTPVSRIASALRKPAS